MAQPYERGASKRGQRRPSREAHLLASYSRSPKRNATAPPTHAQSQAHVAAEAAAAAAAAAEAASGNYYYYYAYSRRRHHGQWAAGN